MWQFLRLGDRLSRWFNGFRRQKFMRTFPSRSSVTTMQQLPWQRMWADTVTLNIPILSTTGFARQLILGKLHLYQRKHCWSLHKSAPSPPIQETSQADGTLATPWNLVHKLWAQGECWGMIPYYLCLLLLLFLSTHLSDALDTLLSSLMTKAKPSVNYFYFISYSNIINWLLFLFPSYTPLSCLPLCVMPELTVTSDSMGAVGTNPTCGCTHALP